MSTPFDETFEPIDVAGFDEEQEKAKIPSLPDEKYKFVITDYDVLKSGENSKVPGTPYVRFNCQVQDPDPKFNGRYVRSGPFMLKGAGFRFFVGDNRVKGFASTVSPSRKWDAKKGIRLIDERGESQYLASFVGCTFVCNTVTDTDDNGVETGFNSMGRDYSKV